MTANDAHLTANQIRSSFISFFEDNGHIEWRSSSVIPLNDPSLLFINAGMNQFKPLFLGTIEHNSAMAKLKRAANSQKCIRAGGKHNDLDDVGKDTYHHTFFEMLGSWSFGDYFKSDAITFAWKLLVELYGLDPNRLYVTYFGGDIKQPDCPSDEDARDLWLRYLPAQRILPFGMGDNFWEMADTGPCGPCSEIHYDRIGGRDASHLVNMDDPTVVEIWNLVFMQFNREVGGVLKPLPAPCVDTGMGFERLVSVIQDVTSNYDTDVFETIFEDICSILELPFKYSKKIGEEDKDKRDMTFRIIADHIRCLTFAISDGAIPSNEGRGYVLRRILRRALRYGRQYLNAPTSSPWFYKLVDSVVSVNGEYFTELKGTTNRVKEVIKEEEIAFSKTLDRGVEHFKKIMSKLSPDSHTFPGEAAFNLYTSYGFPLDLTQIMAEENGLTVDVALYEEKFKEHQLISQPDKDTQANIMTLGPEEVYELFENKKIAKTDDSFKYKFDTSSETLPPKLSSNVLAIYDGYSFKDEANDHNLSIIFDKTNFYVEQGGQMGDTGYAFNDDTIFKISQVLAFNGYIIHIGTLENGSIKVGDTFELEIDWPQRKKISINHTATHLLNFSLRKVLGGTCDQRGSLVAPERLRFDFEHSKALSIPEILQIEKNIKNMITKNEKIYTKEVNLDIAHSIKGVRAIFGESYPDPVRIVSVGTEVDELLRADPDEIPGQKSSIEFCGGTHITTTEEIMECILTSESSISKGIRRIEAVTHQVAQEIMKNDALAIKEMNILNSKSLEDLKNITRLEDVPAFSDVELSYTNMKYLRESFDKLMKKKMNSEKEKFKEMLNSAKFVGQELGQECLLGGTSLIYKVFPQFNGNGKVLDIASKAFTEVNNQTAAFFITSGETGLSAICVVPSDPQFCKLNAVTWINEALAYMGGKGGGTSARAVGACRKVNEVEPILKIAENYAKTCVNI